MKRKNNDGYGAVVFWIGVLWVCVFMATIAVYDFKWWEILIFSSILTIGFSGLVFIWIDNKQ
jgi:hypothetical protein